mmetsp:Transcript_122650/g.392668  ORF Transcript_122650/g.392668 Transcript_122650/m.392668 type:complete len:315 (-) Transcript_122650:957-1901(-)
MNRNWHFSFRPLPSTASAVTNLRAPRSCTKIHHSSNLGLGKNGACTGPAASPSWRFVRVTVTVMVARSPSAMASSSSTSTSHSISTLGTCWQKACTSNFCSSLRLSLLHSLSMAPSRSDTTSCIVGHGLFPAGGSCGTCGSCSSGELSKSSAWTRHCRKRKRPRTASKQPERSPRPCAEMETIARPTISHLSKSWSNSALIVGAISLCNLHKCAQMMAVPLRIVGSLNMHSSLGSMGRRSENGNSFKVQSSGPSGILSAGQTSIAQLVCETRLLRMPRRPLNSFVRISTRMFGPKGCGRTTAMASMSCFRSAPP